MTVAAPQLKPATVAGLLRLPEDVSAEIIDGELVEKAMPSFEHGSAQSGLVGQVLSPSNAGNDLVKELRTLSKRGVPHYWIVDPEHHTLTVMRWTAEGYLTALTAGEGDVARAEPFDAIELDVGLLFGEEGGGT